jgi:uncharacterized CHY-type Zn-finger protein
MNILTTVKEDRVHRRVFTNLTEKICSVCRKTLTLNRFNKNKHKRDGLQYQCKLCQSQLLKESRNRNKETAPK